jgi:hypothetical protein
MKHFTDPTYLRSIYDGLRAGAINKDNATALPIGLVGIYEEALPPESNVNERKKFLEFFAVWAILKKEVSVEFVLPLLESWTEGDVVNYINRYSKWFNSPAPGKYLLYHFNFRAYLLLRIGNNVIYNLHKNILLNKDIDKSYYNLSYLDHAFVLANQDSWAFDFLIDEVLKIEFDNDDTSEMQESKNRWFGHAATLLSSKNNEFKLKELYLVYNKFLNKGFSLELEIKNFEKQGINYLIRRGELFQNPNESVLYWVYFLDQILSKKLKFLNKADFSVNELVQCFNRFITSNSDINQNIITSFYLEYLNTKLRENEYIELIFHCDIDNEGVVPEISHLDATDYFYYGFDNLDSYSKFYFDNRLHSPSDQELIDVLDEIERDSLIENLVKFWFNFFDDDFILKITIKMSKLIKNGDGKAIYKLLSSVKKVIESKPEIATLEYGFFDSLVVEIYKLCLKYKIDIDIISVKNLFFIKDWSKNQCSIQMQMNKISLGETIESNYNKYAFGQASMFNNFDFILNEANCIAYILAINNRNSEMIDLNGKLLMRFLNLNEYSNELDLLAVSYCTNNLTKANCHIIESYFKQDFLIKYDNLIEQLSSVLCKKKNFMDLIHFLYYDWHLLSEVEENYNFVYRVNNVVNFELNKNDEYIEYVLVGFELYIDAMGQYSLDQFQLRSEMPESNVWELEWWVICNVYECIQKNPKIKASVKTAIKDGVYKIFEKNEFDINNNLLPGINKYKAYRNLSSLKITENFETKLHKNVTHHLKNLKEYIGHQITVSKIAGSIQNGLV